MLIYHLLRYGIVIPFNLSVVPLKEKYSSPMTGLTHEPALTTQTQLYQKIVFFIIFPKVWKSGPNLSILVLFPNSNSNQKYGKRNSYNIYI